MITKPELHQTLLLIFFAFLGGLTRELDDLISNKINFKNLAIGIITAVSTGLIFGKILIGTHVSEDMACGLAGLAGFIGPHLLFIIAKGLEIKIKKQLDVEPAELKQED